MSIGIFFLCGCSNNVNKFLDPAQVGRYRPVPAVNLILDTLGVAEETSVAWERGEEPKLTDTVAVKSDYKFMSGDVIRVSIFELLDEGATYVNDYVVTETGKISIPQAGVFEVAGSSEMQFENILKQKLSPNILKKPLVNVTLLNSQQRTFSILGEGVMVPNRYVIPRHDFFLTDALATASGLRNGSQDKVSYIYISRPDRSTASAGLSPVSLETSTGRETTNLWPESTVVISSSEMATESSRNSQRNTQRRGLLQGLLANNTNTGTNLGGNVQMSQNRQAEQSSDQTPSVQDVIKTLSSRSGTNDTSLQNQEPRIQNAQPGTNQTQLQPQQKIEAGKTNNEEQQGGYIEWIYKNGRWTPVQVGTAEKAIPQPSAGPKQPTMELPPLPSELPTVAELTEQGARTRLIKIPAEKLFAGDRRYNIVIKPGDTIFVPVDVTGVFYIMGHVNRQGWIPLNQPMTLKQVTRLMSNWSKLPHLWKPA